MYKNTAGQYVFFAAVDSSDGSAKTSGVDFYITKDNGTQAAVNSATHIGNGQWRIDLTQAETNADVIGICCSGAGVVPSSITIYPVAKKVQDYQTELASINTIVGKLPLYGIADQSLLTAIGNDLVSHRNNYTAERAAKLDNLDATISSRLAASAVPAHFGDLAITETTGKVTVNNVDECKADVSGLATSAEIAALNDFDPATEKVEIAGTKNRLDDLNDIDGSSVTVTTNNDKTGYALTTGERSSIADAVWAATTRTLSSFGTLVADTAAAVWGAVSRTLTAGTKDSEIAAIYGKLPTGSIADQDTLNGVGYELAQHRNNYTAERAAKLDNLDATITSRLAASAAPAHFGDLAITETTGKVTVDNVDDCKADVTNVTVGTNLDKTGYALTTSERSSIATAVWSATTRTLSSFGSLVLDIITGIWSATTRTLTAGTRDTEIDTIAGKLPAGDIADQTTLNAVDLSLTQHRGVYTTERAAKLDNLDVSISSRLAATGYTAPPTVDAIVAGVESEQGKLHETLVRAENTDELMRELTEVDGAGNHRLTAKALEQAPVGESVWSTEQRDAVLEMASTRLVTQSRINTTTTPWRLELMVDQTVVKAYACYDINGAPITSTDAIIAKYVEVV